MAAIEEIPIEAEVQPEKEEKEIENTTKEIEEIQEETPIKKPRGRPPGAKNKAKAQPKPPPPAPLKRQAKTKKVKAPVYEEESSEDEDYQPQPQQLDRHALAGEVLGILQQQRFQRTSARRSHYASWFNNML